MSCNCKNGGASQTFDTTSNKSKNNVTKYVLKSFIFLVSLILLPVIIGFVVWVMFKIIVLNDSVDLKPLMVSMLRSLQANSDEEDEEIDDEEFYSLTEDDVILMEADDITNK